jgi:hypothetical protein
LLLNNYKSFLIVIALLFVFSCSEKKEKIPQIDFENKTQVLETVQKFYSKDYQIAISGLFDEIGKQYIIAGQEVNNADTWGIKFIQLEKSGDEFKSIYETELLEGSFKESMVDKIKISSFGYDLLYYNSQGYYLGSGGGEILSYIIDFENKEVYYAHLVVESENSVSLFISEDTKNKEIVNFFTFAFKKDYPGLVIVTDDIILD